MCIRDRNAATKVNFEKKAVAAKPSRQHSTPAEAPAPAPAAPPAHPPKPRGRPAKRKVEPEQPPVVAEVVTVIEEVKEEPAPPPPPPPPAQESNVDTLNQDEKDKLASDIKEITNREDADGIQRLIDYISIQEPELVQDGVVDTDLNSMKPETHLGLRKLVDEILKSYAASV